MPSINIEGRHVPQPSYEYEVGRLVRFYKGALNDIQQELKRADVTNLRKAQAFAMGRNIKGILTRLEKDATAWVDASIGAAATNGVASALMSLGLVSDMEEATKIARFNKPNEKLVESAVAYTGRDVLAITKNMNASIQQGIRDVAVIAMRQKIPQGLGMRTYRDDMRKRIEDLQQQLVDSADVAIRDAAGRKWTVEHYTETLARTALHNVHTEATTNEAVGRGAKYAIVSTNPKTKDACKWHEGRIIKLDPEAEGDFMTYDELKASGQIFHPNCKHHILPFRRFDRLSDEILGTAKRREGEGRSAMQLGGRRPNDADVRRGRMEGIRNFKIPTQVTQKTAPVTKVATQKVEEGVFNPTSHPLHKNMIDNLYEGKRLVDLATELGGSSTGRIRLEHDATKALYGDVTEEGLLNVFNPDPSKYKVRVRRLTVSGNADTAQSEIFLDLQTLDGDHVAKIQRSIVKHEGKIFVKNDLMEIDKSVQGGGLATEIYFKSEQFYKEIAQGAPINISLLANLDVGHYAWARMGFDFKDGTNLALYRTTVDDFITKGIQKRLHAGEFGQLRTELTPEMWKELQPKVYAETLKKLGYNSLDEIKHPWQFAALDDGQLYDVWSSVSPEGHLGKATMFERGSWDGVKRLNQSHESEVIGNLYFKNRLKGAIIEEPKKISILENYKPVSSIKEANAWAAEHLPIAHVDYKGYDIRLANEMNRQLAKLLDEYEEVRNIKFIGTSQARNAGMYELELEDYVRRLKAVENNARFTDEQLLAYAKKQVKKRKVSANNYASATNHTWGKFEGVSWNSAFAKDYDKIQAALTRDENSKWHPIGTGEPTSVITHEFGHMVDYYIQKNAKEVYNREVLPLLNDTRAKGEAWVTDNLSKYAYTNNAEIIAEAFGEYYHSPNPRKTAKEIVEAVQRAYKQVGKGR